MHHWRSVTKADRIEDIMEFVMRPEFRRVEILHPEDIVLADKDLERLLYKVNEELRRFARFWKKA